MGEMGYGMLQDAFNTPYTVNLVGGVYLVICLDCYKADVTSRFVGYLDAELVLISANELNLTRPYVFQRGYGIPYISIADVYESLALATTVRNDCR